MEGVLSRSFEKFADVDSGPDSLPSWSRLVVEQRRLANLLQAISAGKRWTNSRGHMRSHLISLDREVFDRNKRVSAKSRENDHARLSRLEAVAEQNGDKRILRSVRWRIEVLVAGKDPKAIGVISGALAPPFKIYSNLKPLMPDLMANLTQPIGLTTMLGHSDMDITSQHTPAPHLAYPMDNAIEPDPMSRLDLGGVTKIKHNIKINPLGNVNKKYIGALRAQYANVQNQQAGAGPSSRPAQTAESDDNDEEDDGEEEEKEQESSEDDGDDDEDDDEDGDEDGDEDDT